MRETQPTMTIQLIQRRSSLCSQLASFVDRLSATAAASARTCHDLDEIICNFLSVHGFDQPPGVAQTADDRTANQSTIDREGRFLPSIHSAHIRKSVRICIFSGDEVVCTAKRRFHDTTGRTEDHPGSTGSSQRIIQRNILQIANTPSGSCGRLLWSSGRGPHPDSPNPSCSGSRSHVFSQHTA